MIIFTLFVDGYAVANSIPLIILPKNPITNSTAKGTRIGFEIIISLIVSFYIINKIW